MHFNLWRSLMARLRVCGFVGVLLMAVAMPALAGDAGPIEVVQAAYVDLWTETPGGAFACYGSVLDAATSDPTTVLPQRN